MLDIASFRDYCLQKPGVTEGFPFDKKTLVFKAVKIFAITNIDTFEFINLKCDPEKAIALREQYDAVRPGYHMNKKHWNSVYMNFGLGEKLITALVDHSYDLIVGSLNKKQRVALDLLL